MSRGEEHEPRSVAERTMAERQTLGPLPERTPREREINRRTERASDTTAAYRLYQPTSPERDLWSILAALGEQYQVDYVREYKIKDPRDGWYAGHVDFAWPAKHLAIEVYGGPHHKPALDRTGTRQEDDAKRIAAVEAMGWTVLIVRDQELTQSRWAGTLERVRTFLDTEHDPGPAAQPDKKPTGRTRRERT